MTGIQPGKIQQQPNTDMALWHRTSTAQLHTETK